MLIQKRCAADSGRCYDADPEALVDADSSALMLIPDALVGSGSDADVLADSEALLSDSDALVLAV